MSVPGAGLLALLRRRNEPEAPQAGLLASQSSSGSGAGGGANKYEARSSAVHALEHAVASGSVGEAARRVAQGRHIPAGPEWTYNVDKQAPHEAQPQLPVNPITMINTDYALNHHRQIATNSAYICYGLKAGHIRVLSRASAVRALLKGHTAPLTDLAFAPPPAGEASKQHPRGSGVLLASGGRDGQLYVWHLQVDEDAQAVNDTQQLRASFTSAAGPVGDVLLSWHEPSRRLLAVGAGGRVLLVTVPLGGGMKQLQFDLDEPSTPDATVLPDWSGEAVSCLAFSHDGQLLAAGGAEGTVRVWRLQQGSAAAAAAANGSSGGAAAAPTLVPVHSAALPVGGAGGSAGNGGAVGAVCWLPAGDGHGWVLLTGNGNNSVLQLWHSGAVESGWQLLQSLRFEGGGGGQADFFNHVEVVPGQGLVVLADTARKALYTLHTSGSGASLRFDYVARFGVTLPILSFTAQWNPAGGEQGDTPLVELGCVQTTAVQQYSLDPALCHAGGQQQPGAPQQQAAISRPTSSCSLSKSEGRRHSSHSNHEWEFTIQPQPSGAVPLPSEALAGGGDTTPRTAAASEAAVAASPTAVAAAEAAAAPMVVAAIDDNDSGLPAANGTAGVGAVPGAGEAVDVAAEQVKPVAQQAEQEPEAEPSIAGVVPLSSIPRLQPPPEAPAQGASGEASPEQCPSPPPTPVDQHPEDDLSPDELVAAAEQAAPESPSATAAAATAAPARMGVVAPPPPHLLTPSDLLQSGGGSSVAASAASRSSAGSPSPQRPRQVLQRPSSAAAAEAAAAAAPAVPAALPAAAAAPPAAAALDDAAVAAAVAQQMGGVHKKFVGHVSLMYRELLKALKSELGAQAAAQQQATAQLLATALEAQKQQIEAERAAVLAEERSNIERLLTAISATLNQELPAKLAEAVRGEVAGVAAGVAAAVAPAVRQAVAATLSTELPGAVRGAGLDKTLAPAVAAGLGKPLQEAFRTAFSKQLLPAFESATQEVFQQVNTALAAGLQEHVQASKAALAEPSQLATQLAASLSSAQALAASLSQGQQQLLRAQSTGTIDSRSSPRSAADIRGELTALLRAGKFDAAFSRALGLQDVATVGWLAAQVDAGSVLAKEPCPLSQMVLLSLVQQLATDLTADVAARLTWIREAAMVINPADPVLARHLRPVLEGVHAALQSAAGRLQGAEASSCRLTLHVVHSQLTSC